MKYNLLRSLVVTVWLCGAAFHVKAAEEVKMWPDIPLLEVVTEDGEFPTCEVLAPPEGGIGTGIDAEYVKGRLTMTLKGETLYESGESDGSVSLKDDLFAANRDIVATCAISLQDMAMLMCRGGWPQAAMMNLTPRSSRKWISCRAYCTMVSWARDP